MFIKIWIEVMGHVGIWKEICVPYTVSDLCCAEWMNAMNSILKNGIRSKNIMK
jgi:hypothetical protein